LREKSYLFAILMVLAALGLAVGCTATGNDDGETVSVSVITSENISSLLTTNEVNEVASEFVSETEFFDYKEMAESGNPDQVLNIDSWLGLSFQTSDRTMALTFSIIDFTSSAAAQEHFALVQTESTMTPVGSDVGESDFGGQFDEAGLSAAFGFVKGDKMVQLLSTTQSEGRGSLVNLDALIELGRKIDARLAG
jgi:hypothetical protein